MSIAVSRLYIYPIKSCAGIRLESSAIGVAGLQHDRQWMIVADAGGFMTQRAYPRMALIRTAIDADALLLDAPGMPTLRVPLAVPRGEPRQVAVFSQTLDAQDDSAEAAAWCTAFLQVPCTLVRVHPEAQRLADPARVRVWIDNHEDDAAGMPEANAFGFADGFPLLVTNEASLDDLNRRLRAAGHAAVDMDRFRPNIVVSGLDAFDEDNIALLRVGDDIRLGFVKPCARCGIPNVDPRDASVHTEPGITLAAYRQQEGGVIFGENGIVDAPPGAVLRVGDAIDVVYDF
jgi:uncharacterized protein YcbX